MAADKNKTATAGKSAPSSSSPAPGGKKCPVTKEQFMKGAKPLMADINGNKMAVSPKEFSTGSFGFYGNGKSVIEIDGVAVACQVAVTITAIGSKLGA